MLRACRVAVTPIRYDRTDETAYHAMAKHLPKGSGPGCSFGRIAPA